IRDFHVTGVQTCALPIFLYYVPKRNKIELCLHLLRNTIRGSIIIFRRTKFGVEKLEQTLLKNGYKVESLHGDKSQNLRQEALQRSEERRVGKEGRSRWWS